MRRREFLRSLGTMAAASALPITKRLQDEFFAILSGAKPDRHNWLTPVGAAVGSPVASAR